MGAGPDRQIRRVPSCADDAVGVGARCGLSATPTSTSSCWARWSKSSRARPKTITCSRTSSRRLVWRRRAILPAAKACGPHSMRGSAIAWAPATGEGAPADCPTGSWSTSLLSRIAPTSRDEENRADPSKNPDIDYLLRGAVNDTTARRMGGVAGHAGVFSTAQDVGIYAQGLLDRLAGRPSEFPLTQATVELMTSPQQPGHSGPTNRRGEQSGPRRRRKHKQIRCWLRTIRRSRDRTCAASAGISTRASPCRAATSFPSAALATPVSPAPAFGSTRRRTPTLCC